MRWAKLCANICGIGALLDLVLVVVCTAAELKDAAVMFLLAGFAFTIGAISWDVLDGAQLEEDDRDGRR